ncbi:hypothetical protein ABZZ17_18310 [Streptomyces sp. NPDC006512]|uniref:hypothetical protein n=1 Tax=Streptomyces sp. NPDC006512 TaxID=3154307 RepID=UPI0033BEC406
MSRVAAVLLSSAALVVAVATSGAVAQDASGAGRTSAGDGFGWGTNQAVVADDGFGWWTRQAVAPGDGFGWVSPQDGTGTERPV